MKGPIKSKLKQAPQDEKSATYFECKQAALLLQDPLAQQVKFGLKSYICAYCADTHIYIKIDDASFLVSLNTLDAEKLGMEIANPRTHRNPDGSSRRANRWICE